VASSCDPVDESSGSVTSWEFLRPSEREPVSWRWLLNTSRNSGPRGQSLVTFISNAVAVGHAIEKHCVVRREADSYYSARGYI